MIERAELNYLNNLKFLTPFVLTPPLQQSNFVLYFLTLLKGFLKDFLALVTYYQKVFFSHLIV